MLGKFLVDFNRLDSNWALWAKEAHWVASWQWQNIIFLPLLVSHIAIYVLGFQIKKTLQNKAHDNDLKLAKISPNDFLLFKIVIVTGQLEEKHFKTGPAEWTGRGSLVQKDNNGNVPVCMIDEVRIILGCASFLRCSSSRQ